MVYRDAWFTMRSIKQPDPVLSFAVQRSSYPSAVTEASSTTSYRLASFRASRLLCVFGKESG